MTSTPHILTPISTQYPRLVTQLNQQRQTVLRLPLAVRWLLFLAVYFTLTFGGITLLAFFFVQPTPTTPHPAPMLATVR